MVISTKNNFNPGKRKLKYNMKFIRGTDATPCVLINERYQIYLADGLIYDTTGPKDIPQFVFEVRDKAMAYMRRHKNEEHT